MVTLDTAQNDAAWETTVTFLAAPYDWRTNCKATMRRAGPHSPPQWRPEYGGPYGMGGVRRTLANATGNFTAPLQTSDNHNRDLE